LLCRWARYQVTIILAIIGMNDYRFLSLLRSAFRFSIYGFRSSLTAFYCLCRLPACNNRGREMTPDRIDPYFLSIILLLFAVLAGNP
jgi:hypothetical protein